jgi:RNA polymerase sigma factor for flagellar operon FliA
MAVSATRHTMARLPASVELMRCEQDMNLKEIAAVLGVTGSRMCQRRSQSIARLRTRLREWQGARDLQAQALSQP